MKHFSIILFCFCVAISTNAQDSDSAIETNKTADKALLTETQGMEFFQGTWEEALKAAKAENKFLFLDGYASWCGPCKAMAKNVFPKPQVGAFYNENYINVKMDMEKGEGPQLAQAFGIASYPTFLFFSPTGELVHKALGFKESAKFINDGENALEPGTQLYTLAKSYNAGNKDASTLKNYALALENAGGFIKDINAISNEYMATLDEKTLGEKENMEFIINVAYDRSSKAFEHLIENKEAYTDAFGMEKYLSVVYRIFESEMQSAITNKDDKVFEEIVAYSSEKLGDDAAKVNGKLAMTYYQKTENWDKYADVAIPAVKTNFSNSWNMLNAVAWTVYEQVDDPAKIKAAIELAKMSMDIEENYYNADTYAALQYKAGNKKEAIVAAEKAIELATASNMDPSETKALLEKINTLK